MERLLTFSNQQLLFITVIKTLGIHKAESLCCTLETVTDYVNQLDSNIKQKVYKMKEKLVKEENLRDKQHFTWQMRKLRHGNLKQTFPRSQMQKEWSWELDPMSAPLLTPPSTPIPTSSTRLGVQPPCVLSYMLSLP